MWIIILSNALGLKKGFGLCNFQVESLRQNVDLTFSK